MVTLQCSKCGAKMGIVTDFRFGALPAGSLCIACTTPAFYRAPDGSLVPRSRRA